MLGRLQAEESMRTFNEALAAGGMGMSEKGRAEFTQGLESAAKGTTRPKKATATTLAAMGIVSRTEPGNG
jgi:hypothetical protein